MTDYKDSRQHSAAFKARSRSGGRQADQDPSPSYGQNSIPVAPSSDQAMDDSNSLERLMRIAGSLRIGRVPATGIMRTREAGDRQTELANAIAEFGRLEKTLHMEVEWLKKKSARFG